MPAVSPPDAGELAVYRPVSHPTPALDALAAFNFQVNKVVKSSGQTSLVALVTADNRTYTADYQARSFGYHLKLSLVSAVPASTEQQGSFDAVASANLFLNNHQLAGDSAAPQCTSAAAQAGGTAVVTCTENAGYLVTGAGATFSFNALGVLTSLDIVWVDTSLAPAFEAIPFAQAVAIVQDGGALITTSGSYPQADTPISAVAVVYVPVTGSGGVYYEPVYQLSGMTATGSSFEIYVPALDPAHYGSGG